MRFLQGNLLESKVEALVNTVNTVGVMGKGIALMFKEAFPANFLAYEDACKGKNVKIGTSSATSNNSSSLASRAKMRFARWPATMCARVRVGSLTFQPRNIGGSRPNSHGSSKA